MTTQRHPATTQILRWFTYDHLPAGQPMRISAAISAVAEEITAALPDGPELTTGLRKLLEAKDCFVRAAISSAPESAQDGGAVL